MKFPMPAFFMPIVIFSLAACTSIPSGPSVLVLPGPGKSFDQFRVEDYQCRQFGYTQIGGTTPNQAAATSGAGSVVTGTASGTAAGAAIGGGKGASIGAGCVAGAETASVTASEAQESYDMSYIQCMFAHGNRVPISGHFIDENMPADDERQPYDIPTPAPER